MGITTRWDDAQIMSSTHLNPSQSAIVEVVNGPWSRLIDSTNALLIQLYLRAETPEEIGVVTTLRDQFFRDYSEGVQTVMATVDPKWNLVDHLHRLCPDTSIPDTGVVEAKKHHWLACLGI